ncbi:MAG: PAS domain S-box protein [Nitrosomonadales bacterium]|nr:PAS domain S-box protein [Nitrosomonadales bacterium]
MLKRKEARHYLAIALLACGLALAAYHGERLNDERFAAASRADAERMLGEVRSRIEVNLRGDVQLVKGLVSVVAAQPYITQAEFARAAKPLFDGGSNLRNIGAAPDMVIRLMYPMAGNEKAIGLDFRKTPSQFETADQARRTGQLVLAGPLQLAQGGVGIIARIPVFVEDARGGRRFWGLISAVIDAERLYLGSGLQDEGLPLEIALRGKDGKGGRGEVFFGRPELFSADPVVMEVALPSGSWEMAAVPHGGWPARADNAGALRLTFLVIALLLLWPFFALLRASAAVQRNKDQLAAILNATTESVFHVDEHGTILAINEIGASRVKKTPQDMIGKCAFDYFPPEVAAGRRAGLAEVFRTGRELRTEDTRSERHYALNYFPVFDGEKIVKSVVVYAADITEHKLYQMRLERLLAEQKAILESDLVGIVTVRERKIVWANPAFEKILGYGTGELAGEPTLRCYPDDEAFQAFGAAAYPVLASGQVYRSQIELARKDGSLVWVDISGALLNRETEESLWGFVDITERKQAEIALQEQRNFLSTILENEPECVKVIDADGTLLQMNPAGLAMLEAASVEEINQCGLEAFVLPEHRLAFKSLFLRIFKGESGVLEFEVQGAGGTRRWLETHAAPLRDDSGLVSHLLGVTRDVTSRHEAQARLTLALRGADLAMTDWHIPSDKLYLGEGWFRLLGYQPGELAPRSATLAALIRPEDAQMVRDVMVRHLKGETPYIEAELRMRHKDGHWVWVQARGMAVERSADGRAVRVSGTAMDISSRKQAESEIARLSQWNELLLNSAGEGIYGVDLEGRCTFINPAALGILGFGKEEVLGKNQHLIFHHHRRDGTPYPSEECPIFQTLRDGVRRAVEDTFIRKNGELFPVQLTVTPMHENGRIVGVEAVFQDIAQRKEMEQELIRLATTDPLTGMANRRHFIEQLESELAQVTRFGQPAAFLMIDIDHFKSVNDSHGHAAGDLVLKHFTSLALQRLRRVDLIGRLGGEEFGILLRGSDAEGAKLFAERFRNHVAGAPALCGDVYIPFTISIGIAMFDEREMSADSVMARADMALYRAKSHGRNRVEMSRAGHMH